jgi:putative aminopeptidase FrvX
MNIFEELADLSRVASLSGREMGTVATLRRRWRPWLDETRVGVLGNFIGLARGLGPEPRPTVAAVAHMDCIGFLVTRIEEGGFLRLVTVGGTDRRILLGQEVEIAGRRPLVGVIGAKPPHLSTADERDRLPPLDELYVDTGLPEAEVRNLVPLGSVVLYRQEVTRLRNGWVTGRYLDDVAGLAVLGAALAELRQAPHFADFYAVGTVGEEAGRYPGATTAAFELRPNVAIAVDVTFGVYPDQDDPTSTFPLGGGPAIGVGPNCHPKITDFLRDLAAEADIPVGLEVMPGATGTDAWGMQTVRGGCPTATLCVPLRYMHSPVETVSLDDIKSTGHLLARAVTRVTWAFVEGLSCYDRTP